MTPNRWILLALLAMTCIACDPTDPADPGTPGEGTELTEPPAVDPDPDIETTLAGMERAGNEFPAIAAELVYELDDEMTGDSQRRVGSVKYDAGDDERSPRFYVGFDTVQYDGPIIAAKQEYAFDGRWLTEAKHNLKQMNRYEVVREGQQVETFKLGQGPFPMPFGQQADVLREYFEITKFDRRDDDPENTVHLRLVRKPGREEDINYVKLDMWVDVATFLPVKVVSVNDGEQVITATFENIDTDYTPEDRDFFLPRKAGWEVITTPLND